MNYLEMKNKIQSLEKEADILSKKLKKLFSGFLKLLLQKLEKS